MRLMLQSRVGDEGLGATEQLGHSVWLFHNSGREGMRAWGAAFRLGGSSQITELLTDTMEQVPRFAVKCGKPELCTIAAHRLRCVRKLT